MAITDYLEVSFWNAAQIAGLIDKQQTPQLILNHTEVLMIYRIGKLREGGTGLDMMLQ